MNRYVFAIKKYWYLLLGLNTLILGAAIVNLISTPKTWTAGAELIIPNETSRLSTDLGEIGTINNDSLTYSQQLNPLKIISSILGSDTVMEDVLDNDPEKEEFSSIESFKGLFKISPQGETTIVSLAVDASSPQLAEARLASLIEVFQERLVTLREDESDKRSEFAQSELEKATEALESIRSELASFQSNSQIVDADQQTAELLKNLGNLSNTQAQIIAQSQSERATANILAQRLDLSPQEAIGLLQLNEDESYQFVKGKMSEVNATLVEKQSLFTDEHPEVQYYLQQRDALQKQIIQYLKDSAESVDIAVLSRPLGQGGAELIQQLILAETQGEALEEQAQELQTTIDTLNQDLLSLPSKQANLDTLQQEYEAARATYRGLTAQLQEARLSAFGAYPVIQVLDQPSAVSKPSSPNKKLIAVGAFLSCLSGTGALLLYLVGKDSLLSSKEILTTELEILGHIPKLKPDTAIEASFTEVMPCFQRLASAISVLTLKNRRLLVTSSEIKEGKTTVSVGLASSLSRLGFQVLLVDGNFQSQELSSFILKHRKFQVPLEKASLAHDIQTSLIEIDQNLDGLPLDIYKQEFSLSPHDVIDHLISLAQSKKEYDYIIIDGASLNIDGSTGLMAKSTMNVLMVTRPGLSKSLPFRETIDQLAWYETRVLGVVINAGKSLVRRSADFSHEGLVNSISASIKT